MTVYSVYEPPEPAADLDVRAERLAFVKEGFSWPALLVPGLWLIYHRMWVELIVFCLLFALLSWVLSGSDTETLLTWISTGIVVLFAFEANDLRAAALERRGYTPVGLAVGANRDEAELAFFRAWQPGQRRVPAPPLATPRARLASPSGGASRNEGDDVIGFFPQA